MSDCKPNLNCQLLHHTSFGEPSVWQIGFHIRSWIWNGPTFLSVAIYHVLAKIVQVGTLSELLTDTSIVFLELKDFVYLSIGILNLSQEKMRVSEFKAQTFISWQNFINKVDNFSYGSICIQEVYALAWLQKCIAKNTCFYKRLDYVHQIL